MIASSTEIGYPMEIPGHVIPVGPIFMALGILEDEDPDLATWLSQAPTLLIVLGSHTIFNTDDVREMIHAIQIIVTNAPSIQVLWKLEVFPEDDQALYHGDMEILLGTGRVRTGKHLKADPASLLETGHIIAYVHRSRGNSFYEAIA
jgi:hypothetical protein